MREARRAFRLNLDRMVLRKVISGKVEKPENVNRQPDVVEFRSAKRQIRLGVEHS
jgi:hypothetical protein